jgi:hypothetical protein
MMLSEAIMRGSATLTPARLTNVAAGQAWLLDLAEAGADARVIDGPYLRHTTPFPCGCPRRVNDRRYAADFVQLTVLEMAIHLFSDHVCVQNWTLAMLCEWLHAREKEFEIGPLAFLTLDGWTLEE